MSILRETAEWLLRLGLDKNKLEKETPFYTFPKSEPDKIDALNPHLLDWDLCSGSSVLPNPYLHPVLKEHEFGYLFARCKYCGLVNHSTDRYCFGCGAPL